MSNEFHVRNSNWLKIRARREHGLTSVSTDISAFSQRNCTRRCFMFESYISMAHVGVNVLVLSMIRPLRKTYTVLVLSMQATRIRLRKP